ncbi:MAG: hypothetical protein U0840_30580 [Gemmataceae bacterium]
MTFRWVALVALWTLISGPILGVPTNPASASRQGAAKVAPQVSKTLLPR